MIGVLKQLEAGRKAADVAQEAEVSKHTINAWKAKHGGMERKLGAESQAVGSEGTKNISSPFPK
jgi:putative transposase